MKREIFLTGATGVLGSELVPQLLADPDTTLWLLLRARSPDELTARASSVLEFATRAGALEPARRVRPVRGDVALPQLGIEPREYASIKSSVTHVVHSAGDVRFDRSIEQARRTAVTGLQQILELVRDAPRLTKLEYVSTVGVAGRRTGIVPELPLPLCELGFRNTYEQSKAEAEEHLLAEMSKGLCATIHRPTMIVGHSRNGRIRAPQGFYFLVDYFLGLRGDGVVPDCGSVLMDTVPIDYLTRAIDHSTTAADFTGKILHLASGPAAWSLAAVVDSARSLLRARKQSDRPVTALPLDRFEQHVADKCAAGDRFYQAMAQLLPYFSDDIEFENRHSVELLTRAGIELPTVDSYLRTVIAAYWDTGARAHAT